MTQLQFNLDMDLLKDSIMNSNIETVVKSAIVLVLNEYMEKERDNYLQVGSYQRSSERRDYRNGYYERELIISIGKIKLRVPRTREGEFSPTVFEKYSRVDQALVLSMLEMVVNGVSTRKVTNIIEQLCGEAVSKSFVSSLTEKLDPIVNKWANRPLNVQYYPYLFADAMYIKVREHNKVVSKAVYIVTAMNEKKKREILGLKIDHVESFEAWQGFLQSLKARGLQSPKLVISDAHKGLKKAIEREFIGTAWQRCTVHFKRNIINKLPKKEMSQVIADMRRIFQTISCEEARLFKDEFIKRYEDNPKIKNAIEILEDGFEDSIQYFNEPETYHRHLASTNSLERLNQEIRRRERVIRIFPNTQSAFRLIGALLMENENLIVLNKRYTQRN
ncbi:IS256 family transposase [Neobacillus sp. D3-1R]|uniref:IS256 family transposase n=1 Tax=Neobacillus sp. D3-1R TaxID=3445778 RepID=UPI003FA15553